MLILNLWALTVGKVNKRLLPIVVPFDTSLQTPSCQISKLNRSTRCPKAMVSCKERTLNAVALGRVYSKVAMLIFSSFVVQNGIFFHFFKTRPAAWSLALLKRFFENNAVRQ